MLLEIARALPAYQRQLEDIRKRIKPKALFKIGVEGQCEERRKNAHEETHHVETC